MGPMIGANTAAPAFGYTYLQVSHTGEYDGCSVCPYGPEPLTPELRMAVVYSDAVVSADTTLDTPLKVCAHAFWQHNADNRPRSQAIRSMSVGDVVVVWDRNGERPAEAYVCKLMGWGRLTGQVAEDALELAHHTRGASRVMPAAEYHRLLKA